MVCGLWFVVCGLWIAVCGLGFRIDVLDQDHNFIGGKRYFCVTAPAMQLEVMVMMMVMVMVMMMMMMMVVVVVLIIHDALCVEVGVCVLVVLFGGQILAMMA